MKKSTLELYLILPVKGIIEKQTSVGILLILSAILAIIVANSPIAHLYRRFLDIQIFIGFENFSIQKNLLHWINDGLMSTFFFLIGLELKKEIVHGQFTNVKNAILPFVAAIGGMLVPAIIYLLITYGTPGASNGWGIPMATDIAFALGILYLLGDKVPLSLKILLTAIAIIDDLGAILVIAFFYTSEISLESLIIGFVFLMLLCFANFIGIRNTLFYAIVGIGGLWLAILLSGVHATIAAVLVAFTIPTNRRIDTPLFLRKVKWLSNDIKRFLKLKEKNEVADNIFNTIEKFSMLSNDASPPLHRLESALHPFVGFVVLPIFAFANAGVRINAESFNFFLSPVTLGIIAGLIFGKFIGVVLFIRIMTYFKLAKLPDGVYWKHVYGLGMLTSIGFTMSIFITELAFVNEVFITQAKLGILAASLLAGIIAYFYFKSIHQKQTNYKVGLEDIITEEK